VSKVDLVGLCQVGLEEFGFVPRVCSIGITSEGKSSGQPVNPAAVGKMTIETVCV